MRGRADLGDPRPPVEGPDHASGDHELPGRVGIEREGSDRDRTGTREPDRIVGIDRQEEGVGVVGGQAGDDPGRDEARPVVQPREAVRIEPGQRVVARIDLAGDRVEAGRAPGSWS